MQFSCPFLPFNSPALAESAIHRYPTILAKDSFTFKPWIQRKYRQSSFETRIDSKIKQRNSTFLRKK